jgi:hypothetical protein
MDRRTFPLEREDKAARLVTERGVRVRQAAAHWDGF